MLCAHGGGPSLPNRRAVVRNHLGFPLLLQSEATMSFAFSSRLRAFAVKVQPAIYRETAKDR